MAYSTQAQVQTAVGGSRNLIELADLEESFASDAGAGVALTVAAAIKQADGQINSYIGHRYAVPLDPVPDVISELSASWAARVLRTKRYKTSPVATDIDQEEIDRKWLDGVSKGLYSLGIEPTPVKASIVNDKAALRDTTLTVSGERMKGFI